MMDSTEGTPQRRRRRELAPLPMPQVCDRLPPHSIEAEQGSIGCMLLDPKACIGLAIEKIKKGSEVFYDLRHQALFEVLAEMREKCLLIDPITIQQFLRDRNQLEALGGMPYISGLMNTTPSSANLEYYLEIVLEKYQLRKIIQVCTGAVGKIYDYQGDVKAMVEEVSKEFNEAVAPDTSKGNRTIKALVHHAINAIEEQHNRQGVAEGLGTGFPDLDRMTNGLRGSEMIVIAARPSMGKTALAMNIVEHVAVEEKQPVGVFSLEMTSEALVTRMLCSRARINLRNLRDGFLAERDFPKLTGAAGKLANSPIHIDDTAGMSIMQLKARARRMFQEHGIKLFVIDYLQLLSGTSENRQQEIAQISTGIKSLAKELDVPVIVLAQLNRKLEEDSGKKGKTRKPRLADLRESGQIEADADLVGLLYKVDSKSAEDDDEENSEAIAVNLLIAKQRNGPTGDVHLTFLRSITRYESASKVSDVPTEIE